MGHSTEVNSLCPTAGHSEFTSTLCTTTYLAFAWLTALTNQVIRLAGHSEFTSALCPKLKERRETQTEVNLTDARNSCSVTDICSTATFLLGDDQKETTSKLVRETSTPAGKTGGTKQDIDQTSITADAPSEGGSRVGDLSDIEDDLDDDGKTV